MVGDGFLDCGYSGLFARTPLLCCSPLSIRLLCSVRVKLLGCFVRGLSDFCRRQKVCFRGSPSM